MSGFTTFSAKVIYNSPKGLLSKTISLPRSAHSRDDAIKWIEDAFVSIAQGRWVKAELFEYSRNPDGLEVIVTPVHALRRSLGDVYRAEENYLSSTGFSAEATESKESLVEDEIIVSIPEASKPISRLRVMLGRLFSSKK